MPPLCTVSRQIGSCLQAWFWFIQCVSELQQAQFPMASEMFFLFLCRLINCSSHSYHEPQVLSHAANLLPTTLETPKNSQLPIGIQLCPFPPTPHTSPEFFLKEI